MTVIEVIHADELSDIINPAKIEGVAERKKDNRHTFVVYSHNTKWIVSDNDKIILSEKDTKHPLLEDYSSDFVYSENLS